VIIQLTFFLPSFGSLLTSLTMLKGTMTNALNLEARLAEEAPRLIPLPRAGGRLEEGVGSEVFRFLFEDDAGFLDGVGSDVFLVRLTEGAEVGVTKGDVLGETSAALEEVLLVDLGVSDAKTESS
jgi:hypothetical protein